MIQTIFQTPEGWTWFVRTGVDQWIYHVQVQNEREGVLTSLCGMALRSFQDTLRFTREQPSHVCQECRSRMNLIQAEAASLSAFANGS